VSTKTIQELEEKIELHQENYTDGVPTISDDAFDQLVDRLRALAPQSPIIKKIGARVKTAQKGTICKHILEMGSLNKVNSDSELLLWAKSFDSETRYLIQPKYDGCSLEVIYNENGDFIRAVTRGDGTNGLIVTFAAAQFKHRRGSHYFTI